MLNVGLPGLLFLILMFALIIVPFWRLLPKFGYSSWFSLLAVVPLVPLILLWILAFSDPVRTAQSAEVFD